MKLWRIATETRQYAACDLSGGGAAAHPGRWNDNGEPIVYAAPHLSLAVLETAAYVDSSGLPLNRFVVGIDVPNDVWVHRKRLSPRELPGGWDAVPSGMASVRVGTEWLRSQSSAILLVPSAIVPEEFVALINPGHPLSHKIVATTERRFIYQTLFRASAR